MCRYIVGGAIGPCRTSRLGTPCLSALGTISIMARHGSEERDSLGIVVARRGNIVRPERKGFPFLSL